jgi:hypothetical protein
MVTRQRIRAPPNNGSPTTKPILVCLVRATVGKGDGRLLVVV